MTCWVLMRAMVDAVLRVTKGYGRNQCHAKEMTGEGSMWGSNVRC